MKRLNQNYRVVTSSACAALMLTSVATTSAQNPRSSADARARAEVLARDGFLSGRIPDEFFRTLGEPNKAMIGVTTTSGNDRADTAGVLIESVTPESPAEKAGIKAGTRITAINGINLRISSIDSDDPELQGIGQRRLLRELGKVKIGDEVELRVVNGSTPQTLRIKTVSAADLTPRRTVGSGNMFSRESGLEKRASLGASLGITGSLRDTLGIFVSSVSTDGPAEKAGVIEGDRIAAINGVDVRVPREDAEDSQAAVARVNRLQRELRKLAPGDKVTLRVYGGGRYREVIVTTGSTSDFGRNFFQYNFGDGVHMVGPGGMIQGLPSVIRSRIDGDTVIRSRPGVSVRPMVTRKPSTVIRRSGQQ